MEVLRSDTRVDEREILLRVENEVVFVDGEVDSAAERYAVLEDVESSPHVTSIVDNLILKNYVVREDAELSQSVKRYLMRYPDLDVSRIQIHAESGKIRLEGQVRTYAEKNAAENAAWWSPGVVHVTSHLGVDERSSPDEE